MRREPPSIPAIKNAGRRNVIIGNVFEFVPSPFSVIYLCGTMKAVK
jgi:hypothetical protein